MVTPIRRSVIAPLVLAFALPATLQAWTATGSSFSDDFGHVDVDSTFRIPGLSGFRLQFADGTDHQVRELRMVQYTLGWPEAQAVLRDDAEDDAWEGNAEWVDLTEVGREYSVDGTDCRGDCWIDMVEPINACGETLVLSGFHVALVNPGDDMSFQELTVWPYPEQGKIHVVFRNAAASKRFDARVNYTVISSDLVSGSHLSPSTRDEKDAVDRVLDAPSGYQVLRGFSIRYTDGDHWLEEMQVEAVYSRLYGLLRDKGEKIDHSYRLDVSYVTLPD